MNKKITYLLVVLFSYICVGCSTSEPDLYGSISGVVVDEETQEPLKGVSVTIAPQNATKITASDGVFTFKDLLPDEYNITFKKDEYESEVKKVNVQVGINTKADVVLSKLQPVLSVSVKTLDFGAEQTTLSFDISNSGKGVLEWNISENAEWLSCSETSGKTEKAKSSVVVTILRDGLDKGNYTQNIVIASNGGSDIVTIKVEVSGAEIEIMPMEVDLGEDESSVQFTLTNKGKGNISYKTEVSNNWMGLEPNAGDITTKGYVTLSVNRGSLDPGEYNGTVTFIIGAERISIPVKMTIPVKSKPVVSFDKTKDITYNTATFVGTIVEVGSSNIIRYGFCWSAEEEPTIEDNISDMGDCSAPISFEGKISDLKENTKYYVRAYAENAIGLSYSNVSTFVTAGLPTIPTVQTKDVTNISSNSAIANGTVISLGNVSKITQFGHIWGKSKELSTALASKTELGSLTDIGEYKSEVYELEPNQVYYVCSYATNEKGTAYGDVVEFNTLPADIILSTDKVTDIVHNAATCGGRISDYGGRTIKECGLCWSQSSKNVSITDKKVIGKIDKNMWSCRMEGLEKESTYYVRAYVISSDGTVFYGEIQSFNTTEEMSLVELSPVTISEIETQSVLLQSQIKDRGNCELKECGFCWSTEPSPSIEDESIKYEISSALEYLVQNGIIRITPSGLQTTPLGTLISRNNYEVKTAVKLKDYSTMMGDNFNPGLLIYEISKTHDMPKINTKFRANKDNIKEVLSKNGVFVSFVSNNESTAASLLEWINERKEYEIENYLKVYAASTRRASYEASNLVKYFYDICDVLGNYKFLNEIDKLASRLYYGVKEELIPLVVGIKRLGRQRARILVDTYGDNLGNARIKDLTRIDGIGEKTAENIIKFYEDKE